MTEQAKLCIQLKKSKMEKKRWYAVYTKPRWEKKVYQLLQQKGIESYCPLNKVRRKWSDRIKMVEEPLFKSYVFVQVAEEEKTMVRMTNGIVNFVYWLGKPAVIKDREVELIKRFLNEHESVEAHSINVDKNSRVKIESGVFMNLEGKVIKVKNKEVEILIESIGYRLVALLPKSKVSIIK